MVDIAKGLYILVIEVAKDICIDIGSLGYICLPTGIYGYVGSAKGFGGIEARIKHHLNKRKKRCWWHIDYLTIRDDVKICCTIFAETVNLGEEDVVIEMLKNSCWEVAVRRFGSTDKRSLSHLFRCRCSYDLCVESLKNVFANIGLEPRVEVYS